MLISFNRREDLPEVYAILRQEGFYGYLQESNRLTEIIETFKSEEVTMVVESEYVDKQYRDSYYYYFSQKYETFERNCVRLAFFDKKISRRVFESPYEASQKKIQDSFIGVVVLRPLTVGAIGRTLLDPDKLNIQGYIRTCLFKVVVYGHKLTVKAFPFCSQDTETMTCAETALYNLLQYYGWKYPEYRAHMPSEILQHVEKDVSYERVLPSRGLYPDAITRVLLNAHLYPRMYSYREYKEEFKEIFYTYIESGIPFILCIPGNPLGHAIIAVGHGAIDKNGINEKIKALPCDENGNCFVSTSRLVDTYYLMDDNKAPYSLENIDKLIDETYSNSENTYYIVVPLYRRIFIDAKRATATFYSFLRNVDFIKRLRSEYNEPSWGTQDNPLVYRIYLTASRSYKDFKMDHASNEALRRYYMYNPLPHFIWVMEIGTANDICEDRARVEILMDASSSDRSQHRGILSICYKHHHVFLPDIQWDEYLSDPNIWENVQNCLDTQKLFLTKALNLLYNSEADSQHFDESFEVFHNSNLKEICLDGSDM